ncbi:hypothetical protein [Thalassoroseus pseudoceratinae]|uniref:hypothetical protein n=1 Tax=Thalassoroseus pseudoceratinae TaxID=2713176 RepID=UPI00141DF062|nr:hypothetical protein [Thalassoroseus pseudoceratinae]
MPNTLIGTLTAATLLMSTAAFAAGDQHFAPPTAQRLQDQTLQWVEARQADPELQTQIKELWTNSEAATSTARFDQVVQTFAMVDPVSQKFIDECRLIDAPLAPPEFMSVDSQDEFYTNTMRLYYGRYLAQRRMYDEALEQLTQLDPASVIDPATLLFYKTVAEHELMLKDDGLKSAEMLLSQTEDVPVRYSSVAKLMQFELEKLRKDTLDEVARMMSDVERRLDLARAGRKVQKREAEIIAALDYLIEKAESSGASSGDCPCNGLGGKSNKSNNPAKDSSVKGSTAPGDADEKRIAEQSGWGMLPEKEQAAAKQYMDKNFPPHYRKAMEEYFKRLAERKKR